jgi:glycosyltransferase involved in cell wall biosynthesis
MAEHPDLEPEVFFCHYATPQQQAAAGFGVEFDWDTPLLDGYPHRFLKNVASRPSAAHFGGLDTPEIRDIIAQRRFDAVLVCGWNRKSYWQAIRACWKTDTPVLARGDSHLNTPRSLLKQAAKEPVYRWFIPRLDGCLAVGERSRQYYLHYGARPERIFLVPHVIDSRWFEARAAELEPKRDELRERFRLPQGKVVWLFAGKFVDIKRPMDFVQAVGLAHRAGANVQGLMVGSGPLQSACEQFTREGSVPVTFAGFVNQSDMVCAYVAADAAVLPSQTETWGMVVTEAMTCGIPCFVSDQVGCGPDLISPGRTGDTFPVGDINRFADILIRYSAEPERLREMGLNARNRVRGYSVEAAVTGVLEALAAVRN